MKKLINIILIGLILFFVVDTIRRTLKLDLYNDGHVEKSFGLGVCPFYPEKGVRFILENNLPGEMFNCFNYGHYITWHCYPKTKVFVDGRAGLYTPTGVLRLYPNVYMFKDVFHQVVREYNINYFVLQTQTAGFLHIFLQQNPDWKMIYFSPIIVIYIKNIPLNKELIAKYEVNLDDWPKKLQRLKAINGRYYGKVKPEFISFTNEAKLLEKMGKTQSAKLAWAETISLNPDMVGPYVKLANLYVNENDFITARKILLTAQDKGMKSKAMWTNLGYTYEQEGNTEKAERLYKRAASKWGEPPTPEAYSNLARLYFNRGLFRQALVYIDKAIVLAPNNQMNYYTKGTINISTGRYQDAIDALERSVKLEPKHASSWNNLAVCYHEMGRRKSAIRAAMRALELDPNLETAKKLLQRIM